MRKIKLNVSNHNLSQLTKSSTLFNYRKFLLPVKHFSRSFQPNKPTLSITPTPSTYSKRKFKVLFFGNDEISLPTLLKIYEESYKDSSCILDIGVVTTPLENKKSLQAMFHKFLNDKNITRYELNIKSDSCLKSSWRDLVESIAEKKYDIGVVASFGRMIPGSIITSLKNGAYVMHPSLLPKYRGAAPIQHTLMNREKKTGVSIVECSMGNIDAGDIVIQKEIVIENYHWYKELSLILSHIGADSTLEFLQTYDISLAGKKPQDETIVSKAGLILDNNYVYLDFNKKPAAEILTSYKSFYGSQLEPFTKAIIDEKERTIFFNNLCSVTTSSEIYKLVLRKIEDVAKPGDVYWDLKEERNNIFFKTLDGWLVTNNIKMDCTAFTPGEKVITKVFMNKRFKTRENKVLAVKTVAKKIQVVTPTPILENASKLII